MIARLTRRYSLSRIRQEKSLGRKHAPKKGRATAACFTQRIYQYTEKVLRPRIPGQGDKQWRGPIFDFLSQGNSEDVASGKKKSNTQQKEKRGQISRSRWPFVLPGRCSSPKGYSEAPVKEGDTCSRHCLMGGGKVARTGQHYATCLAAKEVGTYKGGWKKDGKA